VARARGNWATSGRRRAWASLGYFVRRSRDDKRQIPSMCSAGFRAVETMTESMIGADNNNAVQGTVTGSVSLKHIALMKRAR